MLRTSFIPTGIGAFTVVENICVPFSLMELTVPPKISTAAGDPKGFV
jgi:hypothetical protein